MMTGDDQARVDSAFEQLVALAGNNAETLAVLAFGARSTDKRSRAVAIAQQAQSMKPEDAGVAAIANAVIATRVPKWHFAMMQDRARNDAFEAAINRAIRPGMRVLDIGAGSGLLSMMSARAGAQAVFGCEVDPIIADMARKIVADNGFGDQVKILHRHSREIDPEVDLDGQVDVIVSEIIGKDLVCEKVLPSLLDAARRLMKVGGQMIPASGDIRVALAEWPKHDASKVGMENGFDLSGFNRLLPMSRGIDVGDPALTLRSDAATLLRFDFASTRPHRLKGNVELTSKGGRINGVVQWIGLQLDSETWFENKPERGTTSSWAAVFHSFAEPIDVAAGTVVRVAGRVINDQLLAWHEPPV